MESAASGECVSRGLLVEWCRNFLFRVPPSKAPSVIKITLVLKNVGLQVIEKKRMGDLKILIEPYHIKMN